jgi:hypothetical protein
LLLTHSKHIEVQREVTYIFGPVSLKKTTHQPEGLQQLSDQSIHKQLRKTYSKHSEILDDMTDIFSKQFPCTKTKPDRKGRKKDENKGIS